MLVSSLVAHESVPTGDGQGIAITAVNSADGIVQYTLDGNTWQSVGSVSNSNALLLPADGVTAIRFVANSGFIGTVADTVTFRGWDQTGGGAGAYADTTTNGGSSPFSVAVDKVTFSVSPMVGAPTTEPSVDYLGNGVKATLAYDAQGNYVLVWTGQPFASAGVYVQRFKADGTPIDSSPICISGQDNINPDYFSVSAAMTADGSFVVVWSYRNDSQYQYQVAGRIFDATTDSFGPIFSLGDPTRENINAVVSILPSGAFSVTYTDDQYNWENQTDVMLVTSTPNWVSTQAPTLVLLRNCIGATAASKAPRAHRGKQLLTITSSETFGSLSSTPTET